MKLIKRSIIAVITAIALFLSYIMGNILFYEFTAKPFKSDVIIVLGCQIKGRTPSLMLNERLKTTLKLYNKNYARNIIVSGGRGKNEDISEAAAMKAWLVKRGVPGEIIFEESKSTSTYENLYYSKIIMNKKGYKNALLVSNGFHIYRSLRLAKHLNIEASGAPAPTVMYLSPYYHLREILSVIKNYILY